MAKEETKAPQQGEKLDYNKLAAYAQQLEGRLKFAGQKLNELEEQLQMYQMQDYYQRAQLLCMIIANERINKDFRDMCESELCMLVFPPKQEEVSAEEKK